jgi:hypothetical protein
MAPQSINRIVTGRASSPKDANGPSTGGGPRRSDAGSSVVSEASTPRGVQEAVGKLESSLAAGSDGGALAAATPAPAPAPLPIVTEDAAVQVGAPAWGQGDAACLSAAG